MKLDGKKILVTGGTRGIGAALVSQLRAKGCRVLVVARDEAQLAVLERDGVDTLAADLSDPDMPRAIARWVAAEHPDCDVLVNNAAIMDHTFLTRDPLAKLNRIEQEIRINLTAPLQLSTAMLPVLSTRPQAAIVNVTSGLALTPLPNAAVYCATKAGVRMFTKALRHQIRAEQWDIQLSEVLMTRVDTTLSEGAPEGKIPARPRCRRPHPRGRGGGEGRSLSKRWRSFTVSGAFHPHWRTASSVAMSGPLRKRIPVLKETPCMSHDHSHSHKHGHSGHSHPHIDPDAGDARGCRGGGGKPVAHGRTDHWRRCLGVNGVDCGRYSQFVRCGVAYHCLCGA